MGLVYYICIQAIHTYHMQTNSILSCQYQLYIPATQYHIQRTSTYAHTCVHRLYRIHIPHRYTIHTLKVYTNYTILYLYSSRT